MIGASEAYMKSVYRSGEYPKKAADFLKGWKKEFKRKVKYATSVGDFSILMELKDSNDALEAEYDLARESFIEKVKMLGYKIEPYGMRDNYRIRWDKNGN